MINKVAKMELDMKKIIHYAVSCLALLPLLSFSASQMIVCEPPQGTRVDYFLLNNMNLQNETFLMGKDRVSQMRPMIGLIDNKNVSFIIGDTSQVKSPPKSGNMQVLQYNENQISFAGLISGAPILATYYPKLGILIYSQQSIWSGPSYQGARAVIFYSKCGKQTPNP